MTHLARHLAVLALCAAGVAPVVAQAQWHGSASARPAPLYPYELQPGQPYAVEVAPNTYVIHRPAASRRNYPYVRCVNGCETERRSVRVAPAPKRFDRPHKRNDAALIEELRQRHAKKHAKRHAKQHTKRHAKPDAKHAIKDGVKREIIHTTKVVRLPPVVIERRRVVDDPPRVIERYTYEDGTPAEPRRKRAQIEHRGMGEHEPKKRRGGEEKRVIRAEAEVTVLGPDRMSIRLFRKGDADVGGTGKR